MNTVTNNTGPRPVGVAHLVFGLTFCGIAALWLVGNAKDTGFPDLAKGIPVVLIGAGIVGLVASMVNHRRAQARLLARGVAEDIEVDEDEPATTTADTTTTTDTAIIEKDQS